MFPEKENIQITIINTKTRRALGGSAWTYCLTAKLTVHQLLILILFYVILFLFIYCIHIYYEIIIESAMALSAWV